MRPTRHNFRVFAHRPGDDGKPGMLLGELLADEFLVEGGCSVHVPCIGRVTDRLMLARETDVQFAVEWTEVEQPLRCSREVRAFAPVTWRGYAGSRIRLDPEHAPVRADSGSQLDRIEALLRRVAARIEEGLDR